MIGDCCLNGERVCCWVLVEESKKRKWEWKPLKREREKERQRERERGFENIVGR